MRIFIKILLLLFLPVFVGAQYNKKQLDSLPMALSNAVNDTIRMDVCDQLAYYFAEVNPDSALFYAEKEFQMARQLNLKLHEAGTLSGIGYDLMNLMNYPKALESLNEAQKILDDPASEKTAWHFLLMTNCIARKLSVSC